MFSVLNVPMRLSPIAVSSERYQNVFGFKGSVRKTKSWIVEI